MPLDQQDCIYLVREVQRLLRDYDPSSLELLLGLTEPEEDPRRYLVRLLGALIRIYSERSGGQYGSILDRINHFVRLQDGSPVRGVSVALSPMEREVYRTEEFRLAELPDRSEFLAELRTVLQDVIRETESPEERR